MSSFEKQIFELNFVEKENIWGDSKFYYQKIKDLKFHIFFDDDDESVMVNLIRKNKCKHKECTKADAVEIIKNLLNSTATHSDPFGDFDAEGIYELD